MSQEEHEGQEKQVKRTQRVEGEITDGVVPQGCRNKVQG
jgi:hypothetical protein